METLKSLTSGSDINRLHTDCGQLKDVCDGILDAKRNLGTSQSNFHIVNFGINLSCDHFGLNHAVLHPWTRTILCLELRKFPAKSTAHP